MFRSLISVLFWLCMAAPLAAQPLLEYRARIYPVYDQEGGLVVSQERLASEVGAQILRQGGNAVDAAVATGFALAVTYPQAGNLGGGGFMLIHLAAEGRTLALDYREMAPRAAHRDMFLDADGAVDKRRARFSLQAAGVPGTVAGLIHAHGKYGALPLRDVMGPAMELADEGFVVDWTLAHSLRRASERLGGDAASREYFFRDGRTVERGERLVQKDLAATLRRILRSDGRDFYEGRTARLLARQMAAAGGLVDMQDLAGYRVVEREPIWGDYRGHRIASMPPPSSGGVHLVQMLNVLEGWDLAAMGHNSAEYLHHLAEVMKQAYADRSRHLGDSDFVEVPVARLTGAPYADEIRARISGRARPAASIAPTATTAEEGSQTTHFSVVDAMGNAVSNTYTLNFSYGSGISVAGAGFLLNNEMDDFSAKPGVPNAYGLLGSDANAIEGRKRPLSSMTPTIVFKDGKPAIIMGSPGGSRIISSVLQGIVNIIDFEMNVADAVSRPRMHHQWQPDRLYIEDGISVDTVRLLRERGHEVQASRWNLGNLNAIRISEQGAEGYSDSRRPSGAAVPR